MIGISLIYELIGSILFLAQFFVFSDFFWRFFGFEPELGAILRFLDPLVKLVMYQLSNP